MVTRLVTIVLCPECGAAYHDRLGDLAGIADHDGPILVGCVACGLLFRADEPPAEAIEPGLAVDSTPDRVRYRLERLLGRGGMGEAWLAVDRHTGQRVCVKRLLPSVERATLRQEWAALVKLQHPNVVRPLALHEDPSMLVMAFVEGESLSDRLRRSPLPSRDARSVAAALADALVQAHRLGVIHRDLKPANIMLRVDRSPPEPVILDFGLSIVDRRDPFGAVTAQGNAGGTPAYMAPEQIEGRRLTPACDVYAWALVAGELLSGRALPGPPSLAGLAIERMGATEGLEFAGVTADWGGLLRGCTRADPARRPSMVEVALALGRMGEPGAEPTVGGLRNLDFNAGMVGDRPVGWGDGVGIVDGVSRGFRAWLHEAPDRRMLALQGDATLRPTDFGVAHQALSAVPLRASTLRWSGLVCTDLEPNAWATLWLRVDDADGAPLYFENLAHRAPTGRSDWARQAIEARIPDDADRVHLGVLVVGRGTAFFDDLRFDLGGGQD